MALDTALAATRTTLYYCCLPVIVILRFLWAASAIIIAPIVHVARYLFYAIAWPVRQLAKLEASARCLLQ